MADRTVSVKLEADVSRYVSDVSKAAAATKALGSSAEDSSKRTRSGFDAAGQAATQLGDRASESTRKVGVSAAEASRQIAGVRAELAQLGRNRVGVGVDTVEARAELARLQQALRDIESSDADARVDAETAAAEAQLRSIQAQLNQIDGQSVRATVDVDDRGSVQRAASSMQTLTSTALAVSPALGAIGAAAVAGLGAVAPMAASAAAGLGVLALGFSGVGDAVKLLDQRQEAVAANAAKNAASQVSSARQVEAAQASLANAQATAAAQAINAAERVADAERNVSEARRDAAEGVERAQKRAAENVASALRQQESAERALGRAQVDVKRAQEDLTRARIEAAEEMEDLQLRVRGGVLAERQAILDLAEAQKELNEIPADASAADREQLIINLERAKLRVDELKESNGDLSAEQAEWARTGVEGSRRVQDAQGRLADAQQGVADAARAVGEAAAAVNEARVEGAADVARAEREGAEKIADAQRQVASAVRAQAEQQRQSAASVEQAQRAVEAALASVGTTGVAALASIDAKLAEVGPSTMRFAQFVDGTLQPAFERLQETAAAGLLPGVQEGLESLLAQEPRITRFVDTFARSLGGLTRDSLMALSNPQWQRFFDMLEAEGVPQLESMWRSGDNLAESFASIMVAFAPLATDMAAGIEGLTERFRVWSAGLAESQGFREFESYVRDNWPKIRDIIANVAETIGTMIEAGAPIGAAYLQGFVLLTEVLAGLPVDVVQALLMAFLGYKALSGVAGIINGIAGSLGNISAAAGRVGLGQLAGISGGVAGVGTAAGAARGNVDGFTGAYGRFAAAATGAAAIAAGMTVLGTAVSALDSAMAPAPLTMEAYTAALLGIEGGIGRLDTMAQQLGSNTTTEITGFGDAIARVANPGAMDRLNDFGGALFNVVTLGASDTGEGAASRRRTLEFLGGLDGSLAQLVTSGHADLAAEKFRVMTAEAERNGVSVEQLQALFPEYQDALQGVANDQALTGQAVGGTAAAMEHQYAVVDRGPGHFQAMVGAVGDQLGIYNQLLQEKTTREQQSAQATADGTASATGSWQAHVGAVGVSLDEYAARLDEDVVKKDAWRADIKAVTERGGVEVGAALLAMGEEGARIADDMANATDADFRRMAESMANHARNGGAQAAWEMDQAMRIMASVSRDGSRATALAISKELGIGLNDVIRLAGEYGIQLATGMDPILQALGKASISVGVRNRVAQQRAGRGLVAADGAVFDFYANGGVAENHVAQIAPAGSWRVWAEPETGGEAYIPLAPGKRGRSLDIWRETGRRLDAPEAQYFAAGGFTGPDDVPRPTSTAPYRMPISTAADETMRTGYDETVAWVKANAPGLSGGTFGASGRTPNGVGGLGPMAAAARQFVMQTFGVRNIGGYSYRTIAGTKSLSDHALGKAIDVMIPNYKSPASIALGNRIASHFVANPKQFGTKYVIWRDQINSGRGWGPYGHPGGGRSDTLQHRDHVHVSFFKEGGILNPHVRDSGGPLLPGFTFNGTGGTEHVLSAREKSAFDAIVAREFSGGSGGGGAAPQVVIHSPITFAGPVYGEQSMRQVAEAVVAGRDEALARNVRSAWS